MKHKAESALLNKKKKKADISRLSIMVEGC